MIKMLIIFSNLSSKFALCKIELKSELNNRKAWTIIQDGILAWQRI
jgi:hypothetical protein